MLRDGFFFGHRSSSAPASATGAAHEDRAGVGQADAGSARERVTAAPEASTSAQQHEVVQDARQDSRYRDAVHLALLFAQDQLDAPRLLAQHKCCHGSDTGLLVRGRKQQ